jgi:transcriptional regulator with XRE-family HTH domain
VRATQTSLDDHPLRRWRIAEGLSLTQAAKRIGVPKSAWCAWEYGRAIPNRAYMTQLRCLTGNKIDANSFYFPKEKVA